ncbi:MAG: Two-component transcriptional response regulator, LuxR family, partial [uncultured Propionibacteriaceae bacterium]
DPRCGGRGPPPVPRRGRRTCARPVRLRGRRQPPRCRDGLGGRGRGAARCGGARLGTPRHGRHHRTKPIPVDGPAARSLGADDERRPAGARGGASRRCPGLCRQRVRARRHRPRARGSCPRPGRLRPADRNGGPRAGVGARTKRSGRSLSRTDRPRGRRAHPPRPRPEQRRHSGHALCQPKDSPQPRVEHPRQVGRRDQSRGGRPCPGRRLRRGM